MNPIVKQIAEETHFNIYNSPIWNGTGERFVEAIIRECALVANLHNEEAEGVDLGVGKFIKQHFGVDR